MIVYGILAQVSNVECLVLNKTCIREQVYSVECLIVKWILVIEGSAPGKSNILGDAVVMLDAVTGPLRTVRAGNNWNIGRSGGIFMLSERDYNNASLAWIGFRA
jgi:hypothetical protein